LIHYQTVGQTLKELELIPLSEMHVTLPAKEIPVLSSTNLGVLLKAVVAQSYKPADTKYANSCHFCQECLLNLSLVISELP